MPHAMVSFYHLFCREASAVAASSARVTVLRLLVARGPGQAGGRASALGPGITGVDWAVGLQQ